MRATSGCNGGREKYLGFHKAGEWPRARKVGHAHCSDDYMHVYDMVDLHPRESRPCFVIPTCLLRGDHRPIIHGYSSSTEYIQQGRRISSSFTLPLLPRRGRCMAAAIHPVDERHVDWQQPAEQEFLSWPANMSSRAENIRTGCKRSWTAVVKR